MPADGTLLLPSARNGDVGTSRMRGNSCKVTPSRAQEKDVLKTGKPVKKWLLILIGLLGIAQPTLAFWRCFG
jgi:hypothetical protein